MKDIFLRDREREFPTTIRVLRAMPEEQLSLQPSEKASTAQKLAWTFVTEERLLQHLMKGGMPTDWPAPPNSFKEIIQEYEVQFKRTQELIARMSEDELKETADFYVAPKTPGKIPKMNLCWMLFYDSIHHRGQFSVYLRLANAKVPSIYGPTADEPWT